jgi:dihydropteroate synthase
VSSYAERLIEPLGLLRGEVGEAAMRAGLALPLCGGRLAYGQARLIGPDGSRLVAAGDIPADFLAAADRLAASPPDWAGLGTLPSSPPGSPPGTGPGAMPGAVMGIVNVTPDSFSDGGDHLAPFEAIAVGQAMLAGGAAILDVGGESTRPGAAPLSAAAEQDRILPVVSALAARGARVSVDTRNAATMRAVLAAGAAIINDVSALAHDPEAASMLAAHDCPVVLMHMRGAPDTMNHDAQYEDVALEVLAELAARLAAAEAAGIARHRIALDPGIGFAKIGEQNHELLRRLPLLLNLGCPLVVGVSRKRFIGRLAQDAPPKARLPGSLAAGLFALAQGASVLRVHDVAETVQAVRVWRALAA